MKKIEETIAKYVVDANLFRLGSTNAKKIISSHWMFFGTFYCHILNNYFNYLKIFKNSNCLPMYNYIGGNVHRWNFPGGTFLGGIPQPPIWVAN